MVLKTVNLGAERTEYRMIFKQKERKMARKEMVTLTNMCLIEDKEGRSLYRFEIPSVIVGWCPFQVDILKKARISMIRLFVRSLRRLA